MKERPESSSYLITRRNLYTSPQIDSRMRSTMGVVLKRNPLVTEHKVLTTCFDGRAFLSSNASLTSDRLSNILYQKVRFPPFPFFPAADSCWRASSKILCRLVLLLLAPSPLFSKEELLVKMQSRSSMRLSRTWKDSLCLVRKLM